MQTPSWFVVTLLLASLPTPAVRASDLKTRCMSSTVTEGERAVITYHLQPDIDYSTGVLYIRRDQEPGHILICDGTCDVKNGHFRSAGIVEKILILEAPAVTQEEQGCYYLFAVVDGQQQTPCACNLTVVAKAAVPPPAEDGTNVTKVVPVVVGLLVCIAIGLLLFVLVMKNRRNKKTQNKVPQKDSEKGSIRENGILAGDGDDTTKSPKAEGERDVLLSNDASDQTSPLVPTCQPDTGLSCTTQALAADELARDFGTTIRVNTDAVCNSHVQAPESSVDATKPSVEESAAALRDDKGSDVSVNVAGLADVIAPTSSVDLTGHSGEERPASLLADPDTKETVIFVIESIRSTDIKLRAILSQHPDVRDMILQDKIRDLRKETTFTEMHDTWEPLRRELARKIKLPLVYSEVKEQANTFVNGAPNACSLANDLSTKFRLFRQETGKGSGETDKTFATSSKDRNFNNVCLCLNMEDMVSMSVGMRNRNNHITDNMLERVANELDSLTHIDQTNSVSLC